MTDKAEINNLELWSKVSEVPTEFATTSNVPNRGNVTSINSTYIIQRATEIFGLPGIGWGYEILEDRYDNGPAILNDQKEVIDREVMHTLKVNVWIMYKGQKAQAIHYGHTPFVSRTQYGPRMDSDPAKKSLTDALKKALSMFGFAADVFLGKFDDADYVKEKKAFEEIEKSENFEEAMSKAVSELTEWAKKQSEVFSMIPNVAALNSSKSKIDDTLAKKSAALKLEQRDFSRLSKAINNKYNEALDKIAPICELTCNNENCSCSGVLCENARLGSKCVECGTKLTKVEN